ncbi:CheY-P phosphatase CheC [Eubacterium plexicaudatum ASF492]|uniref:Chemotaxis protein CheC n=1 Tax=Eubacterium plexicaudatum ASF492 TaxID=1235802 RepID=N2AHU8_9FIRM|nr:CheY-P phosphatase CheC [Eubacterium plexicaudatum ASF492]
MGLFDQDGKLDTDVQDVLYELGNVGVGMASITMGRLLDVRIELVSPNVIPVTEVSEQMLLSQIEPDDIGIWMRFAAPMSGFVLFLLKRSFVRAVVEKMTGNRCEKEKLFGDEIAFSAVTEFANMLSAAYMKAIGNYTNIRIFLSPYMFVDKNERISLGAAPQTESVAADQAIWVETRFQLSDEGGKTDDAGRAIMLPDGNTVQMLMRALGI